MDEMWNDFVPKLLELQNLITSMKNMEVVKKYGSINDKFVLAKVKGFDASFYSDVERKLH